MSDKYLVEAKTLFEYRQYLLATKALKKSDKHFQKTYLFLKKAEREGKGVGKKEGVLKEATAKHKEVLGRLLSELPSEVNWQEERKAGQNIQIKIMLKEAIKVRNGVAQAILESKK
jgi:hypothetical protein